MLIIHWQNKKGNSYWHALFHLFLFICSFLFLYFLRGTSFHTWKSWRIKKKEMNVERTRHLYVLAVLLFSIVEKKKEKKSLARCCMPQFQQKARKITNGRYGHNCRVSNLNADMGLFDVLPSACRHSGGCADQKRHLHLFRKINADNEMLATSRCQC